MYDMPLTGWPALAFGADWVLAGRGDDDGMQEVSGEIEGRLEGRRSIGERRLRGALEMKERSAGDDHG